MVASQKNAHTYIETRKGGNSDALQFEDALRHANRSWLFMAKFVLSMRRNCYFCASRQNLDIEISSDPDFLQKKQSFGDRMIFHVYFVLYTCRSKICNISVCRLFALMTLNTRYILRSTVK